MDKSKKYKIAFIHPDLGIGGAERLVLDVAVALAQEGNEIVFVTNHFDRTHTFAELRDDKYPVRVIGDWIPRSICGICQALCAYVRMVYLALVYVLFIRKEDEPDVYFIDQIPMAVPFIKWVSGKVVYYCHHPDLLASPPGGSLKKLYRLPINWLELKGTAMADVLLVNSKYTASVFRKTFPEIRKDIQILYPTISSSYQTAVSNSTRSKPLEELLPEIQISKDSVVFLSINRYHPAKKLELALTGLEALKNKLSSSDWSRVHLIMAGGYDPQSSVNATYFSKLVNLCQEKDLTSKVTFLKSPSDNLKAELLLTCDCLVYTPINEHFGIVPLEAMVAGKPVIACNSGGPCETVLHLITGYLCEPTPDSLAEALSKMLNKVKSRKMGFLGKKRLEELFSHAAFTASVNNIVAELLDQNTFRDTPKLSERLTRVRNPTIPEENLETDKYQSESTVTANPKQETEPNVVISVTKAPENIEISSPILADPFMKKQSKKDDEACATEEIETELNVSGGSTTETCYLSPRDSSKGSADLDVSNSSSTAGESAEVADEAFP